MTTRNANQHPKSVLETVRPPTPRPLRKGNIPMTHIKAEISGLTKEFFIFLFYMICFVVRLANRANERARRASNLLVAPSRHKANHVKQNNARNFSCSKQPLMELITWTKFITYKFSSI